MSDDNKPPLSSKACIPDSPGMVMLVDDQAIVGEAVRRLLAQATDLDLHYCSDALNAQEQAREIKPSVILLDLVMPQLDGFELLRRFRADPTTVNIPIVVLSTTEDPTVKGQAFTAGADDYLVKLPDKVELIARLRYHAKSYQNLLQRDEAYRALRESQQQLLDSNTALTALNQAFHQAKEDAERANQAKSEFLSRMSHELRTPLNAILGFGQILEMEELAPRQDESVQHIMKAGTHLLSLINEVLDIARVESGRLSLSLEPIEVSKVVEETIQLIRPLSDDAAVHIQKSFASECSGYVIADRQRLKQVFINLFSNAVKYNRPGGSVTISCIHEPPDKVRLRVTDTGRGISEADMEKLFVPFERLRADASGIEGTGLGLALSRRLVEAMGGTLDATSVMGQGSTFSVVLPAGEDPLENFEESLATLPQGLTADLPSRTVLLIEDNISNLKLIETIFLQCPEITLLGAMQGSVGLDLARQHQPDLILLDLHLPDISGSEVLKRLRQDDRTAQIPVIVVSADATASQIDRLLAAGAVSYLTKPLNVPEFLGTVGAVLQKESS